ncbi:SDR family oxidoreductase [Nonomuraea sp. NPDC000554]|uniref:SDR family NAD(P)-dependent oxidoreductase n=1 Tax=Nonomuraea sp. NPDC000554 TaxID=3154259 RepID=UPI00332619EC
MTYRHPEPLELVSHRLAGRAILVTGASSGIGAAAARRFCAEGARVALAARRTDALERLAAELREDGHEAIAVTCDVTDEAAVSAAVDTVVREYGGLDGAFNNAGVGGAHLPLHEIPAAAFDSTASVNLRGVFLCMKYEIRAMLGGGGGAIVNTSSVAGLAGTTRNADYAAAKFGLEGLVRSAALDYAADGIRVNAIAPGPTRSEMFDRWMSTEEARAQMARRFPLNYIAHPDDMARAALFLLSDESRWTTGTVLPCDGGFSA